MLTKTALANKPRNRAKAADRGIDPERPGRSRCHQIDVTLALVPGRPRADLTVDDDSAEGFRDLTHAYTLFAHSYKRDNPEQRGQYNLGEKMVLAVCEAASISTTKGTVIFDPEEGRIEKPTAKARTWFRLPGPDQDDQGRIPPGLRLPSIPALPKDVIVTLNGERLLPRKSLHKFEASLETLIADEQGVMRLGSARPSSRSTKPCPRSAEPLRNGPARR